MRTWRYSAGRSPAVVAIAWLCWCASAPQVRTASHEDRDAVEERTASHEDRGVKKRAVTEEAPTSEFRAVALRHRNAKTGREQCEVAKSFAASKTHFWEACVERMKANYIDEYLALGHFASAYYKRGPQQKEELVTLLQSRDEELVGWLLLLLTRTCELDEDGRWLDKALGGAEIAGLIARVYATHPRLGAGVAQALYGYGPEAKGAVPTLLRIIVSRDPLQVFGATLALRRIDFEGVYSRFGLESVVDSLDEAQQAAIEKYLAQLKLDV
jgi:hypothetical protein